jgi:hypothetical protein
MSDRTGTGLFARRWKHMAAAVLAAAGVAFLVALALREREAIAKAVMELDPVGGAAGLLLLIGSNVAAALLFADIAAPGASGGLRRPALAGGFLFSQIAKYVPGRVWGVIVQGLLLGAGVSMRQLVVANIETTILVMGAVVGTGASLAAWMLVGAWLGVLAFLLLWLGLLVIVRTRILAMVTRWVQSRFPARFQAAADVAIPPPSRKGEPGILLACLLMLYAGGWLVLLGSGFGYGWDKSALLVSLLCFSYALGVLSLLPAGFGAREAAFVGLGHLLHADISMLASIAVLTRIAMVIVDLASLPVAWMMWRTASHRP